ncbi:MAG TPA: 4-(cytidine 5'-diphospho)-2-C-methyl-D-erythritol kinase [Chthoniobacterales bacterium]|nr:4-(cytidine 5'-diphospho)-2-C-methyl-D-erythritol kinase [Chthoniobacterales bacterium]
MQLRAPAKINLSFRILRRREDGFHEIETLMIPVSLYDEISLTISDRDSVAIEFACYDPSLPPGDDNLVVRAARLFLQKTDRRAGLKIELRKAIPHGAGLGGGSSDAASVLLGLNRLLNAGLRTEQLTQIAAEIGSDVPFFIYESAAICRGRGELVTSATLAEPLRLLLIKPPFGVATPWAYQRWHNSKELPQVSYTQQTCGASTFVNDLERPVFEKYVFLARMKMWLLGQPEVGAALMSGSGSTVFAVVRDAHGGEELASRARAEVDPDLWTCLCQGL